MPLIFESTAAIFEKLSILDIQNKIYNLMAEKGWYKTTTVEQSKIDTVKQKFSANN